MSRVEPKKKIAILGGGIGSLSAAFELTSTPELRERYDVTVYQLGWRLGGKGATGRNQEVAHRIESHGPHAWAGFYENAFRLIRACYAELGRSPDQPLSTWREAFRKRNYLVLSDRLPGAHAPGDGWFTWSFVFPPNDAEPGDGHEPWDPWITMRMAVQWLWSEWNVFLQGDWNQREAGAGAVGEPGDEIPPWIEELLNELTGKLDQVSAPIPRDQGGGTVEPGAGPGLRSISRPLHLVRLLMGVLPADPRAHSSLSRRALIFLLELFMSLVWRLLEVRVTKSIPAYKTWVVVNLVGSTLVGLLRDNVFQEGLKSIDDKDLRAWLRANGANDISLSSAPVAALYDFTFSTYSPLAAGTAIRGALRQIFTYKGAIFYEIAAESGDTIVAPLYQVLSQRGVKFAFFHRVARLRLTDDARRIGAIEMMRQVRLAEASYEPLIEVSGLPCWPSRPLYDQIVDGEELRLSRIDLESDRGLRWRDETPMTLTLGADFDLVVLGISIGALPPICEELARKSACFGAMLEHVRTVSTQGFQLWLTPDRKGLGWKDAPFVEGGPILESFAKPFPGWADQSFLIRWETWPAAAIPRSLAYWAGPLAEPGPLSPSASSVPLTDHDALVSRAAEFLGTKVGVVWPKAAAPGRGFRWDWLIDLNGGTGEARLKAQYFVHNPNASDRYVLSVPGSSAYRLKADASGFSNLYLAGDWLDTGLNSGCMEGAVIGGFMASQAICGVPAVIIGAGSTGPWGL